MEESDSKSKLIKTSKDGLCSGVTENFIVSQGKVTYGHRKYCIHWLQSQASRYIFIRTRCFINFIKISSILTDRFGIKFRLNIDFENIYIVSYEG